MSAPHPAQLCLFPERSDLIRIDADANVWRFYEMAVQPDLFGGAVLMRRWGRIGTAGRLRLDLFQNAGAAANAMTRLHARRIKRGYSPRA